ncbi:MAG: LPS export ABC transporter periplasmic protein LptC [Bacteroidota bacterium]
MMSRLFRFGFLLILIGSSACENDLAEVAKTVPREEVGVETARDVVLMYSDSAEVRVKVFAPVLERHLVENKPKEVFPKGLKVEFLGPNKEPNGQLTSKYAIRYEDKRQIVVRDSVVWESRRNERLETEELIWDERKQLVSSKKYVKITKPDEIITGYGFEADQDFTKWKIEAVEGKIKIDGLSKELNQ